MTCNRAVLWSAVVLACLVFAGLWACSPASPIEEIGDGWIRLNGIPDANNPHMEIGCVHGADVPTLTMYVGSDSAASSGMWTVQIGEWQTTDMWEWNNAPGYKGGAVRTPKRPLDFTVFDQMVNSPADTMTITMGETYKFSLGEDIRTQLRDEFPENCYTSKGR